MIQPAGEAESESLVHYLARQARFTGETDKVHLNMGWNGCENAYYEVTSDFSAGSWTWDAYDQVIVVGIEPDYAQREDPSAPCLTPVLQLLLE